MSRPTKGVANWKKHWKGNGNIVTVVKTQRAYFKDPKDYKRIDHLKPSRDVSVIYIDSLSQEMETNQNRVAFQFGNVYDPQEEVYYASIDAFRKPRSTYSGTFKPQVFGLTDKEYTLPDYVTALKNSITSRSDITGDLEEYLIALVDYAYRTTPVSAEFQITDFEPGVLQAIRNDFGECIGPIYAIQKQFTTGVNFNSKIKIPSSPNEPTLDYYIITGPPENRPIKVSAKSGGVSSNTLKVGPIIDAITRNNVDITGYRDQYEIMNIINTNSVAMGPIKCAEKFGYVNSNAVATLTNLKSTERIPKPELFLGVIQQDSVLRAKITTNSSKIKSGDYSEVDIKLYALSHACENLVIKYSRDKSTMFTSLIKTALANDIFFVYFTLNQLNPYFSISKAGTDKVESGQTLSGLILRSKNGYTFTKNERLGFDVS